ncbi:putative transcriptional regulator [Thermoclostridium stercorarium subsp. stercorarium DSM 8532]|uniref:Putative transcriptional regulator n=1 Tax=Thermoclostridium stercorarium (strain ATCC 35414 / DSM 8532 / NCIMB 11754) TaxID=1121335 RepID=L7VL72_THES1|nr:helix-turn-helix transcriptional regulator [Thermoclostridium stercorarium]AGC67409.1 putative transcriptional regulator [Thermoclostridium stercorarium subsp. stercorarium DSM 8532]AGI38470.1 transcriptional regulator [Thermoclostridium stercorarium subsp. stercorarium DSM 8532]
MAIGDRIKKLRIEKGMTQEELAKYIDSTKQTIYKYENNIVTNIPSDKIEKIAEALGTTPSYLMGWNDTASKNNVKKPITVAAHIPDGVELTEEDIKQINDFIQFIISKKKDQK